LIQSETGSGKTFAYLLPVLHVLAINENSNSVQESGGASLAGIDIEPEAHPYDVRRSLRQMNRTTYGTGAIF
jgi:ATP-dependent helicase YprA (DUF1998 family)